MRIRIGTRGSKLALWQAYHVQSLLEKGGIAVEIEAIETKGDKIQDVSLSKIGSKGLFTEELEEKLRSGEIDIAVHSAKDVQSTLDPGLELIAFTEREEVNDVLLSINPQRSLDSGESFVVGTSSVRRVAFMKHYYPHIQLADMRGNLQTRLRKMEEGVCDALLLAYAGVHRMEYDAFIAQKIPTSVFTPAVGQGSVAVECASVLSAEKREAVRQLVNHVPTEYGLLAERMFLKVMQGGCSIPVFCLATLTADALVLSGGIVSLDGQKLLRETFSGPIGRESAGLLGTRLAEAILAAGGGAILKDIKASREG